MIRARGPLGGREAAELAVGIAMLLGPWLRCPAGEAGGVSAYDVVWTSPSAGHDGSMPLGNGDISVNAWVEPTGDLLLYLGKTDSWGDNGRLLKVGRVRVTLSPALSTEGGRFRQTLDLLRGEMRVESAARGDSPGVTLRVWVDASHPVVQVDVESEAPHAATARIELWRTQRLTLPSIEISDVLMDRSRPDQQRAPTVVEPDTLITGDPERIGWYHHNIKSVGPRETLETQGLSDLLGVDPLLHRTFGVVVTAPGGRRESDTVLRAPPRPSQRISLWTLTRHPSTPGAWREDVERTITETERVPFETRVAEHRRWWAEFWSRSWIRARESAGDRAAPPADETSDAFVVSRGYQLQRYLNACAGRGAYPIKFNGSIFTVPSEGGPGDADYRRWGPGYWWQNTRLPYFGMCAAGDFDLMRPLFDMYTGKVLEVSIARTRRYFGHGGAYFPECVYPWGAVFSEAYGWTPAAERGDDKLQETGWHKREWVGGLELVWLLLDAYEHTLDAALLSEKVLPTAREVLEFFEAHHRLDERGRLLLHPAQALETWWDCTNPMPEVAGLHAVTARLLALPGELLPAGDRAAWRALAAKLPDPPVREVAGQRRLAAAERFARKQNIENPELYAVFPFRLFAVDKVGPEDLALAVRALEAREDRGNAGWRQDDIFMAYLARTKEARAALVNRARKWHEGSRFPAFWGPNYDWVPDQDHGSVLIKTLQAMLLQSDGEALRLLAAWPADWDVDFKLHAPRRTVVEGAVRAGRLVELQVTPESRRRDLRVLGGFQPTGGDGAAGAPPPR